MRRTRPSARPLGVTLIEMVIAIAVTGIVIAATIFFAYPLRQAVDSAARADLTDTADNALQRIGREVRLALPNSVRVDPTGSFIEFIPVRTAGRYRFESSGVACGGGTDELAFDAVDTCFKTIGPMPDVADVDVAKDYLVFNNFGAGFDGQNAYASAAPFNVRKLAGLTDEGARQMVTFTSTTPLDRTLHDSPGKRFYIVPGDGTTPAPVTFECTPPSLRRWSGYAMTALQPTVFGAATPALLADNVASCQFSYEASAIGPGIGLLTLRITLSKPLSGGTLESVTLYHSVHVNNVP